MINQIELLDGLIHQIASAKNYLFEDFRANYEDFRANYEGFPVDELNARYRASCQATQDVLMKCMKLLIRTNYELKNK